MFSNINPYVLCRGLSSGSKSVPSKTEECSPYSPRVINFNSSRSCLCQLFISVSESEVCCYQQCTGCFLLILLQQPPWHDVIQHTISAAVSWTADGSSSQFLDDFWSWTWALKASWLVEVLIPPWTMLSFRPHIYTLTVKPTM